MATRQGRAGRRHSRALRGVTTIGVGLLLVNCATQAESAPRSSSDIVGRATSVPRKVAWSMDSLALADAMSRWELSRVHEAAVNANIRHDTTELSAADVHSVAQSCALVGDYSSAAGICSDFIARLSRRTSGTAPPDRRLLELWVNSHWLAGEPAEARSALARVKAEYGLDPESSRVLRVAQQALYPDSTGVEASRKTRLRCAGISGDPRVQALRSELETRASAIQERVQAVLGCDDLVGPPYVVTLVSEVDEETMNAPARFLVEYQGQVPRPSILIAVEPALRGEWAWEESLAHEFAHYWHFVCLGMGSWRPPDWLSECIAVSVEQNLDDLLFEYLRMVSGIDGEDPLEVLRAPLLVSDPEWNGVRGCLVLQCVRDTYGIAVAESFVRHAVRTVEWGDAVLRASGDSVETFEKRYRSWALPRLERYSEERTEFMRVVGIARTKSREEGAEALRRYLVGGKQGLFGPLARLELVACLSRPDPPPELSQLLKQCRDESWKSERNRRVALYSALATLAQADGEECQRWSQLFLDKTLGYSREKECTEPIMSLLRKCAGLETEPGDERK